MNKPPIEGSEDRYKRGTPEYEAWTNGRAAYMEGEGNEGNPYHQPHHAALKKAWSDGYEDEKIWALDSTGR